MGLSCSAVFHPELFKQALQRPEPPELHGHLVVLSLTDDAPETITAELGLLISRQHAPKPAAPSRGPPQLTRFLSAAPAPSLPTGKPKLQRLTSEGTRSGAEALGVKWSDRWTLPPVTLRPKTEAPVHLGLLDLRDLEGLQTLVGEPTALDLALTSKKPEFCSQAFPWSNSATMLLCVRSERPLLELYSWAAAALLEEFKERCYSACFLHWCLASLVLPRLRPSHLAQALCEGLKEDGSLGLVASVACLGQAVLLDGPMAEVPPLCWSLLQQLLARFPAKRTERAETEEKEKDKEQWMSLAPGLQNSWLSELGLRPVERLSVVEEVLALVQSVAWAECTSLVPSYRGHMLRPLLPDLLDGLRDLRWPALGKKGGEVVSVSGAPAASSGAFCPAPRLQRSATALQRTWTEAAQQLRQTAGLLAVHGEELATNIEESLEALKVLGRDNPAEVLLESRRLLMAAEPKIEEWRAMAEESMRWLGKEDERQKERVAASRSIRDALAEVPADKPTIAKVSTLFEGEHTVRSLAKSGERVVASVTGGMLLLSGTSGSTWLNKETEPGFHDGPLTSARLGERACALASCQDGSILVADTSNHRIRQIPRNLSEIHTIAGSGTKGQRDGAAASASFSLPCAVLELGAAVCVLEEAHPGTVRIIEGGIVMSVTLPMGKHNMKDCAAFAADAQTAEAAFLAHSGGVCRLFKAGEWKVETVLEMKGITGLTHLWGADDLHGFVLSRKDYRLSFWDAAKGGAANMAGQVMSRGAVDGMGTEARFSAPGQQLVLGDGSLLVADGRAVRRLETVAMRQTEFERAAMGLERATQLAAQRAEHLKVAWDEALELLAGPLTETCAARRRLCERNHAAELGRCEEAPLALALAAPSVAALEPALQRLPRTRRFSAEVAKALQTKLANYFWPPSRQPAGAGFLQADLEALQRMVAGGVLSADAAVVAIDGPWFSRQVGFVPALVSLFETMHKCFFERQVNLAMVRWALRRYVRSSFTRVAKEMQDRGADDAAMSKAFGQWLVENLQPLDQELGSAPGLPWLLEDLLSEHLVGDSVESRTWFLQQNAVFDARFDSLGPSLALLLRRVAADLPMRRVVEALIDTEATGPVAPTRQEAELLATCLETSLEPPKREAKEWKEPKEPKEPKDGKEWPQRKPRMSDLAEVLKCDLLSWGRCLRWFNSAQESLPDDLQDRLAKCIAPGKAGLQMLAEACEKGSLSVSALGQLVAGSDGGDALELAGLPGASAALQRWQKRLVEAGDTLQSLVESCKSLWPSDAKLHLAIGRVSEAWPELPAAMALRGLSGEEPRGPLAQVPRLLLLCSPALALLGTSGAFQALWTQGGCGQEFKEAELQLSAIAWAGFYTSLEKPEASDLRVVMLEPVLERLQQPEELRLMAVTGRSLRLEDGEVLSWTVSDPGDWETKAEALARRLWHGVSVKRAFGGLKKTLAQLKDKFLDAAGQKDADGLLAVLGELEPHFAEWEVTELKSSEKMMQLASQIDPRLLMHSEEMMTSMLNAFELLQWLRKMPDDADYLVRVEIALGRSEMEVPDELWLSAEGRVDESKLSALTAVRTTLHDLIFRSSLRLPSLDALLQCLASLENSSEIPGLIHALNFAHSMHGPLSELLVGKDAALARMLQMLKPSSHARWVMSHRSASSAKDEEQEAAIPAEARLLHLALNSPGSESSAQRLVEILDFQASVTLAASTSDSAYGQVAAFNEQIGLVRLAAAVLDDLREAGHPDFQEIHVEWPLSMALAEMKQRLHALRERQGNWRKKLTELQQRCPVLGFFAARQLGALLRTLKEKNLAGAKQVLAAVAQGWRWPQDDWAPRLARECPLRQDEDELRRDSEDLQSLADALQASWPAPVLPAVSAGVELGPGAHVVVAPDNFMATATALWPYLMLRRPPGPEELLLCHSRTPSEQLRLLLLRWAHASGGFFCLLLPCTASFAAQQAVVQAVHDATDQAGPLPTPRCPLLLVVSGSQAAQAQVATQLMAQRAELRPPLEAFPKEVASLMRAETSVHVGPHCGSGKTFSVRMAAEEAGAKYCPLKLTRAMSAGELAQELRAELTEGTPEGALLHLDLSAGPLLDSEAFAVALFELLILGRVGRRAPKNPEGLFTLDAKLKVAIELPAGVQDLEAATWRCAPLLSWLPLVRCTSQAAAFQGAEAKLRAGMGLAFAAARHDGVKDSSSANAYQRLQYVCGALGVLKRLHGAFPLHYEGISEELSGETCYELLVEAAKLQLRPSLWNLWAFVDVLYWQLKEVHHPESVANQACLPEGGAVEKKLEEIQPQDCPIFKGELIAFILRTARDFATRQTRNNEVDPETVVAADLVSFHQDRFCGRWRLQPFSSDGYPVFARYDKSEKGSGQFFLYYRAAQKMWTIDAELDKVAPAFAYTRKKSYAQGWWRMASWVQNKHMQVRMAESALGYHGEAVEVHGVDQQLTGSDEEYLVALNGVYLRQPKEEDVNHRPHYVLEKPRRHLFWDQEMDCWCFAHICHSDEGVYAKSCQKTIPGSYLTMGKDEQVVPARVTFVTAKEEAQGAETAAARAEPEDGDFPLLRWEDSSHDCMLFSNKKHQVCFLSSQPSRLRISMHPGLLQLLEKNNVSVGESMDAVTADHTKVLGCLTGVDRTAAEASQLLDGKYCLTGDAVLKMLAIFVRMRCGLPVILMGECGCGKTELVRYLCAWLKVPLVTLNVHGGTTEADMDQVFQEARAVAETEEGSGGLVVFLDEVNTSQHVNMLCEAVLERSYRGRPLPEHVTVLAALNPRRKRPQTVMTTGLVYGGSGSAEEEMSNLVYRVHAVPETVNDFLFDFGALTKKAEEMYVRSMVHNCWPESFDREQSLITSILCLSQDFIRWQEGDPSAVSLRDVKRCLRVAKWMQERFAPKKGNHQPHAPSVVVAIALVYHYRIPSRESRHKLWVDLARRGPWPSDSGVMKGRGWAQLAKSKEENGLTAMENLLLRVQGNVAKEFEVEKDVVMNEALAENVFVGLLCIMNRIPLFIVGKPGTSKTLCMQVLLSNLQGKQSKSKVLQTLPALRIMQYQCSPLSTADGIQRQFDAASRFASNALDAQVVLLLDEVGLAEFSPDMPLKVLHGMLADPGIVAVVGLSNWRLDPAKMNRSVCLARPDPDSAEVGRTGAGLLAGASLGDSPGWLTTLSGAFWDVFADQGARDWLGMRDYYSFVRHVRDGCLEAKVEQPSAEILAFAIRRNFGGQPALLERMLQAMLPTGRRKDKLAWPMPELLSTSLADRKARHLLLASQGSSLPWLQAAAVMPSAEILLGSDFPEDASEAYAIRQLMRVRDAMAKGRSLVLCGMDVIYEALYDVLNQRYVRRRTEEGQMELMLRLAIGARSQLCPVAETFKLLVLVDQEQAFKQLDVPFLNRFEKQLLVPQELLSPQRCPLLQELQSWAAQCSAEAGCELLAGGVSLQSLASLLLARPQAQLEELQRCVFEMALPLPVFRSNLLQKLQHHEEEYFKVRGSLASAMQHVVSKASSDRVLCELATSSPMAHMPPLQQLASVGGTEIIPVSQLSGSQQLEDILDKFFSFESSSQRILVLQLDVLSGASRLALTKHCCTEARNRARTSNAHIFLIQHRAGWVSEKEGYTWQPQMGWESIFVDDLQGSGGAPEGQLMGQSLKEFLQLSVHELQQKQRIPSLAQTLLARGTTCLARCVPPSLGLAQVAERVRAVRQALQDMPGFVEAVESLAMLVLMQWRPEQNGLHLHLKLAMQEMRFGSLRKSVWLSIERLQLSALTHALRWLDTDFNLRHVLHPSSACCRLWLQLAPRNPADPAAAANAAPQVIAAALKPGAALQGPAPVANHGRGGPLLCRCPFSARLLSGCAGVTSSLEDRDPGRLRSLCARMIGDGALEAFQALEAADPGALLHDAVAMWAPLFPHLDFEVVLKVYTLAVSQEMELPVKSPLELVVGFQACSGLAQAICSLLSLVEAAFGDGEQNAASLRLVEGLTSAGGLAAAVAEALGALDADDDFVERARPHVQMLLFTAAAKSDALQMAPSWWRLRVKLHFRAALRCRQLPQEDVVPELQPGDLLTQDFWRGALAKLRTFASSERSEEAQVEEVCAEALCRGLTVLEDLLPLKGQCADLAQAVWSLVMQPDSPASAFGLTRRLPGPLAKGLLRWLHMEPVKKVLPPKPMEPKTVQLLLGFLEDVTEPEPCSEEDLRLVQTTKCTPQLLAAAARLRRALCEYARSLAGAAEPPPLPKVLSDLLRLRSPALFAAKVLRRLGGDQELCRLAGLRLRLKGGLDWFPLDGARLPRLSDDLPDPFVPCAFQCIEHKEKKKMFQWFLNVCSAAGVLASSAKPDAASFDKAVKQASAGLFPRAGAVVACVASRVLMNRQVASQEGLSELGTWLEQRLEAANAVRKRAKVLLMQRMCSSLLPHLEELACEEGEDAPPRRFLEQLALLLCVLAIDSNGTSASWLELALMAPNDAQRFFWPTMPDSEEAAVLGAMGFVGWYTCRNGHPYSVGECTRPMQQGVCPVAGCGARIGGEHHVNVQGVKTVKQESLIKKATPGYIAATSDLIDQTILNQFNRQLNMRGLQSLRMLVHVTLWASLSSEGASRAAEAAEAAQPGCRGDVRSAAAQLHSQIVEEWKDLRRRTRLPGRELGAWLHLSVLRCTKFAASRLSTEEERLKFEADFQIAGEQAVLTALTGEDRKQMDVGTDYTAAAAAGFGDDWKELCDRWEPSVYDTMETALPAALWHGRACVTLEEFEESFLSRLENRRAHPVLAVVLKQRRRLGALPALPALLAWHAVLFEAFEDYALTREDARQLTNREAIERLPEHRRPEATKRLQSFCEHFNRAFPLVERLFECEANPFLVKGEVNLPGAMTPDTPVIFSLPYVAQAGETEAPSLCTVQLANVLQTAQNDLVEALDPGDRTVPLSSSTAPNACSALLASLDLQADLLPLLHQYRDDLSNGLDYDLAGLEEALARRLRGAVRIQVQLRHFRFGGELKDSGRLAILRQKLPQEPLPFGMAEELQRELQRSESLEAARQLRAVLEDCIHLCLSLGSFGSAGKAAVQAQTPLAELLGASGQAEALPAALRSAKLCHLQDLYMELVRSNDAGDALAGVALAYQEPLEDELLAELQKSAEELAEWLPVLHDLLAEQLVVDRFPPGSSLKEFLGFAAGEDPPECFPEQLELRHALAVHRALERAQS